MSANSNERRRLARVPVELRLEYRGLEAFVSDYTKNLSRGGIFVRTARPFALGTRFSFQLAIPQREEAFTLQGEVVWQRGPPGPGMGVRFVWPDPVARSVFEAAVDALIIDYRAGLEAAEVDRSLPLRPR